MDTVIIAFGTKARRGKDFAVQTIIDNRKDKFDVRRYAWGDNLKREVNESAIRAGGMFNLYQMLQMGRIPGVPALPDWVKYDPAPPMNDPLCPLGKQRDLLQWWGTEFRRARNPYYWIQKLATDIQNDKPQIALISDLRMMNEFQWVVAKGGHTVKLERLGFYDVGINTEHPSERALDGIKFEYEIQVMDGDLEELKKCALQVFDMVIESYNPPDLSELNPIIFA